MAPCAGSKRASVRLAMRLAIFFSPFTVVLSGKGCSCGGVMRRGQKSNDVSCRGLAWFGSLMIELIDILLVTGGKEKKKYKYRRESVGI